MRLLISLLATAALFGTELSAQTIDLFNGRDLTGWEFVTQAGADIKTACSVKPDGALAVTGKPVGYLATTTTYANYRLHLEYRWPADAAKNSNSGVLLHIASGPIDRGIWPQCFQVQTKISRAGDLLPMAGAKFAEALTTPANAATPQLDRQKADSEKAAGEWNVIEVVCQDGVIEVTVNGVAQNHVTGCRPAAGKIGVQLEGTPYELRYFRLTPLKTAK